MCGLPGAEGHRRLLVLVVCHALTTEASDCGARALDVPLAEAVEHFRAKGFHVRFDWRDTDAEAHLRSFTGSIPAYAGEPPTTSCRPTLARVYPRVCGGTRETATARLVTEGLSPRMRGNREHGTRQSSDTGSIPAYAGEPRCAPAKAGRCRVYPRVCGGTWLTMFASTPAKGLSPRMRGNPQHVEDAVVGGGSIPAYAGEPRRRSAAPARGWVYPCVCGGTHVTVDAGSGYRGLSPRMRGNRPWKRGGALGVGSIPAYAGEPRCSSR